MMEAAKGFRRLKAYSSSRSPGLRLSLALPSTSSPRTLNRTPTLHSMINGNACFAYFNKIWGIPPKRKDLGWLLSRAALRRITCNGRWRYGSPLVG